MKKIRDKIRFNNYKHLFAKVYLLFICLVAILAPFIANNIPVLVLINKNKLQSPVLSKMISEIKNQNFNYSFRETDQIILSPLVSYSNKELGDAKESYLGPSFSYNDDNKHILGTDSLGRDVLAQLIYGARSAIILSFACIILILIIGTASGTCSAYYGDKELSINIYYIYCFILLFCYIIFYYTYLSNTLVLLIILSTLIMILFLIDKFFLRKISFRQIKIPIDSIITKISELIRTIPALILIIVLINVINSDSFYTIIITIGLIGWVPISRFVRAETLKAKNEIYVKNNIALGMPDYKIIFKHILPNTYQSSLIYSIYAIVSIIILEASLSFLGIGIGLEYTSWGAMLNEARKYFPAWWLGLFPGLLIFFTVISLNTLANHLARIE